MGSRSIPNVILSLNPQELKLLQGLIEKEKEVCRQSLVSIGRWTERLEQYFHTLLDLEEKVEEM